MAKNLRDRGYSSSMDGYQPKNNDRYHSRNKTVADGEASVRKGRPAAKETAHTYTMEQRPPIQGGNSVKPLKLYFTDSDDAITAYNSGPGAYSKMLKARRELVPAETSISTEDIKRRMKELEEAMAAIDSGNSKFRLRKFDGTGNTEYMAPYYPYSPGEEHPGQAYADYSWDQAELLDDAAIELGLDETQQQLRWMDYIKAAAIGRVLEEQHNQYIDNHGIPGYRDAMAEENQYGQLFNEYNNLKNEYNVRLAQYLQGLR